MSIQYTRDSLLYIKQHAEEIGDESISPEAMVDLINNSPDKRQFTQFLYHHCEINIMEQLKHRVTDCSWLFWNDSDLTEIVIPGSCEMIPTHTFASCHNLTKVTIEEGIKFIASNAFYSTNSLTNIKLPQSVTDIGSSAFEYSGLESIDLGNVVNIDYSAFEDCHLKSITIPKSCKKIDDRAFFANPELESVTIEDGLVDIGAYAFCNCPNLKVIEFPQTLRIVHYGPTGSWNNGQYNSGRVKYKIRGLSKMEAREWAKLHVGFYGNEWWNDLFIHKII